jgi:NAD(P)-dependent dehydrogenase (short-subunit alcohol dehydrogenase family)
VGASSFRLEGKRALVTGGSRGIGRAIALALADAGADVAVTSRKGDDAEPIAQEIRAKGRRALALLLEVRNEPSIRVCFERLDGEWGGLDVLVNNAGTNIPQDLVRLDEESWDTVVDSDLKGLVFVTQAAVARMIAAKRGGRIVNIASIYGIVGRRERVAYSAAKGGVVNVTRSFALELAPHGITVNAVGPSAIETDLTRERFRADPGFKAEEIARTPLGRLGTPEDVAAAVVFFASDAASFVTGQTLLVDGGTSAH